MRGETGAAACRELLPVADDRWAGEEAVTMSERPGTALLRLSPENIGDVPFFLFIYLRPGSNGTPLQYSCLENPMDGGAW